MRRKPRTAVQSSTRTTRGLGAAAAILFGAGVATAQDPTREDFEELRRRLAALEAELDREDRTPSGRFTTDQPRPGDTNTRSLDDWDLAFGVQYRVMYNASNIPGPGGSSFADTADYDFFRQRLRLNLDLSPKDTDAGAFVQVEFRGGSGGSAPRTTDPRALEPRLNAFNFIDARGIRFGYLYWDPAKDHRLTAGIVPESDRFGDTLFSADWDFSVGGVVYHGQEGMARWRIGALHTVEGVGSADVRLVDRDGALFVADYDTAFEAIPDLELGVHAYGVTIGDSLPRGATDAVWLGATARFGDDDHRLEAFGIVNFGSLGLGTLNPDGTVAGGFDTSDDFVGFAAKVAGTTKLGDVGLRAQLIHTSGDGNGRVDRRFVTPQGLFGTLGYWGFTHIFTPNGPSDVNDLALEIGNGGAGLWTVQGLCTVPLCGAAEFHLSGGWFEADRARNGSRSMGWEVDAMVHTELATALILDVGVAHADLGGFYGAGADDLYEAFTRFQLQF